jgi:hypothetical protein
LYLIAFSIRFMKTRLSATGSPATTTGGTLADDFEAALLGDAPTPPAPRPAARASSTRSFWSAYWRMSIFASVKRSDTIRFMRATSSREAQEHPLVVLGAPGLLDRGVELRPERRKRRAQLVGRVGREVGEVLEGVVQAVEHLVERRARSWNSPLSAGTGTRSETLARLMRSACRRIRPTGARAAPHEEEPKDAREDQDGRDRTARSRFPAAAAQAGTAPRSARDGP